ncbi:MAG TPA: type II toxin-antitoxin system HicB family antitoxin [Oscillatoriaceae cyanobacterium]
MNLIVEFDREEDGRWIADVPAVPGVMVYGGTRDEALTKVQILALHVIADAIEQGELQPEPSITFEIPTEPA